MSAGTDAEPAYRSLFISDTHLYSEGCRYLALHEFLKAKQFSYIYLVGDIVDLWQVKARNLTKCNELPDMQDLYGSDAEKSINIIRRLLKRCQQDKTRLIYLPGNHDDFFRNFDGMEMFGVAIRNEIVHVAADGKRYLVLHGDRFDTIVHYHRWLAVFGSIAYDWGLWLNHGLDRLRSLMGGKPWSLAKSIKSRVDGAVVEANNYVEEVFRTAAHLDVDGVICGHSHMPGLQTREARTYANCGDWVEHSTALVEHLDGTLSLLNLSE